MTSRLRVVLLSGLVVVAGLLAWRLTGRDGEAPPATPPAAPPRAAACAFETGHRAAFRLESSAEALGVPGAPAGDRLESLLSWQVLSEPRSGEWVLRAALSSTSLTQRLSRPDQRITQTLDRTFALRLGRDCRFLATGFPRQWEPRTRRLVATLLRTFEFALGPGSTWDAEQGDGMGRYTAHYTASPLPDGAVDLVKLKSHYATEDRQHGGLLQVQLVKASATARLDRAGRWLESAQGTEEVRLVAQGALVADLQQRFALRRDDAAFVQPDGSVEEAGLDWQDPFLMPSEVADVVEPGLANLSLEAALGRFEATYRKAAKGDGYAAARLLSAWLKAHPEGAALLLARLRGGALAPELHGAAFLALERCGTPEARAELSSAVSDPRLTELDRARAASALSDVPVPTPESARALVQAARDTGPKAVSGGSVRALGHLQERTEALDPALHEELRNVLLAELQSAATGSRQIDVIDGIGNTGDEAFAPELGTRLADPSRSMREHAARALRRMEVPVAAPLLLQRLPVEPEAQVRATLADTLAALGVQDEASLRVATQVLASEPSADVRAALIRWLGAAVAVPVARQALIAQFHREQVPGLLQLIGRFLPAEALR